MHRQMGDMESEEKLAAEVHLLRKLCRSLDTQRKKSHQEAVEWQNLGRFTAAVLQKEVDSFERKLRVLQERMSGLVAENKELQEICFYLDKTREKSSADSSRTTAETMSGRTCRAKQGSSRAPVHSMCAEEMNKDSGGPPLQYAGITSDNTLRDKKVKNFKVLNHTKDPQATVQTLQKRLEKLESEKLELVKSLSAAHLLATGHQPVPRPPQISGHTALPLPPSVEEPVLPPEFQSLLESYEDHSSLGVATQKSGLNVSADMIMQAVTLLDMCRRMDAMETNGFSGPDEEKEVALLRVLMSIAWQKLQEESKPK